VAKYHERGDRLVVVVSAMSGVTDNLIKLAKEIILCRMIGNGRAVGYRRADHDRVDGDCAARDEHPGLSLTGRRQAS
jgi:aspartokinase